MQYPVWSNSGTVAADGTLTISYQIRGSGRVRVPQVTNEMTGAGSAKCSLRLNGHLVTPLVAAGDAAAGDPPVWMGPADVLAVVWSGAPVGLVGNMSVFSDDGNP